MVKMQSSLGATYGRARRDALRRIGAAGLFPVFVDRGVDPALPNAPHTHRMSLPLARRTARAALMGAALLGAAPQLGAQAAAKAGPEACAVGNAARGTRVLVFSRTKGFRHGSIPSGIAAITELGAAHRFEVVATEDPATFTDAALGRFAAVVFLNTTGDVLDSAQQASFERYVRGGGGFVGVHSASDTEYDWPWYGRLVGAYFKQHPAVQNARISVEDRTHLSTKCLPPVWTRVDEWYDFRAAPKDVKVLLTLDESSYRTGTRGAFHPVAWYHRFDGGRAFYTELGHTNESYADPAYRSHLAGAILWAAAR
jgi:type 1 glutamine amidotransferase